MPAAAKRPASARTIMLWRLSLSSRSRVAAAAATASRSGGTPGSSRSAMPAIPMVVGVTAREVTGRRGAALWGERLCGSSERLTIPLSLRPGPSASWYVWPVLITSPSCSAKLGITFFALSQLGRETSILARIWSSTRSASDTIRSNSSGESSCASKANAHFARVIPGFLAIRRSRTWYDAMP
jgi:hypothetical protein